MPRRRIHNHVVGDILPAIGTTLTLRDGTPVNLNAPTVKRVTFRLAWPHRWATGGPWLVDAEAVRLPGGDGRVRYDWLEHEVRTPGLMYARWTIHYDDGTTHTFPAPGYDEVRFGS